MNSYEEYTFSFIGGANDSAPATRYAEDECASLVNGRVSPEGAAQVRYGSRRLTAEGLNGDAQGYGIFRFTTSDGTVQWIAFAGNSAYASEDEGETWEEIATALATGYWSSCTFRQGSTNTILFANGGASSYQWDGTTWDTIANIPNNVRFLATFNERVYAAGHDGVTLRASKIRDFETWSIPSGLSLQIAVHDGDAAITGLFQVGASLLVFKPNSVSVLSGFGNQDIVVAQGASGVSRSVGCAAFRTIQAVGNAGVCWLSSRGMEYYDPGNGIRLLSHKMRTFFASLAWSNITASPELPCALYWPSRHEYWCAVPGAGSAQNNHVAVYNALTDALSVFRYASPSGSTLFVNAAGKLEVAADASRSLALLDAGKLELSTGAVGLYVEIDADGKLALATTPFDNAALMVADLADQVDVPIGIGYDGIVRALESAATDDQGVDGAAGQDIAFTLRTRPMLGPAPTKRKRGRRVEVHATSAGEAVVNVTLLADGERGTTHALTLPAAIGDQPKRVKARVSGKGRTLQAEITTTRAGLEVAVVGIMAEVLREAA